MADLVTIRTEGGKTFRVARDQAQRFQDMLNDIELRMPLGPDSGGYANRHIAGTNTPSRHATGHAVDLNWGSNPEGPKAGSITKYLPPEDLAALKKTHGVTWGGDWNRPFKGADVMHFETPRDAAPAPIGAPSNRMPASSGLNDVPEQGPAPLSLLPSYRGPFSAPPAEAPVAVAAAAPRPSAPAPMPTELLTKPPEKTPAKAPFEAPTPPAGSGLDKFHGEAVAGGQKTALDYWAQMQRRKPPPGFAQIFGGAAHG